MKKRHIHNKNKCKSTPDPINQVDDYDNQLRNEVALLLIELKAFASQLPPKQQRKSRMQNILRLKEVDFLTRKKKAS